jgi:ectoine hydroxylase-related dioxygenase (phytanoyl-CoA dioxygenase family)
MSDQITFASDPEEAYRRYMEDGFFIEPGILTAEECQRVIDASEKLPNAIDGSYIPMMNVHKQDHLFVEVMSNKKVVDIMRRLVHGTPCGLHTQMYYTPPQRAGLGFHQDNYFVEAKDDSFASAWIALVDVTPENGGLFAFVGSHKRGRLDVREVKADGADARQTVFEETVLPEPYEKRDIFVKRGSAVFLHGYNVHGSYQNNSQTKRYVILNTYIREGEAFRPGRTAKREQFELLVAS